MRTGFGTNSDIGEFMATPVPAGGTVGSSAGTLAVGEFIVTPTPAGDTIETAMKNYLAIVQFLGRISCLSFVEMEKRQMY